MNYRQLQQLLKAAKNQGLTDIKLNAKFEVLQAEYDRLYSNTETEVETETAEFFARCSQQAKLDRASDTTIGIKKSKGSHQLQKELANPETAKLLKELDAEIEARMTTTETDWEVVERQLCRGKGNRYPKFTH